MGNNGGRGFQQPRDGELTAVGTPSRECPRQDCHTVSRDTEHARRHNAGHTADEFGAEAPVGHTDVQEALKMVTWGGR